jgi:transglutaminase-like putative cysteine protease
MSSAPPDAGDLASLELLDHHTTEWDRVRETTYLVHQHLRYQYPGPIVDLRQRLLLIPPAVHVDQRRVLHRLDVSLAGARQRERLDRFGNLVVDVRVERIDSAIEFESWAVVTRRSHLGGQEVAADARLLAPTRLTRPDPALRAAAAGLAGDDGPGARAERICQWVYREIPYEYGLTHVRTTAAEALALGRGVCQDKAHVMLALCRLTGLPARYVSGHLLGEGASHAWVEVLVPDRGRTVVMALDPTHGRPADLGYVTIAVGRDYADVAPMSGSYAAPYAGQLTVTKRVGLASVDYGGGVPAGPNGRGGAAADPGVLAPAGG